MKNSSKFGFTLVEMLVVIGIIGVLMGVLVTQFGGATASARSTKCLSNLRNLANAVGSFGMAHGRYPYAGSFESVRPNDRTGELEYHAYHGWIGPTPTSWGKAHDTPYAGNYPSGSRKSSHLAASWHQSTYASQEETWHAITNGCLWSFTGKNRSIYVCPEHLKELKNFNPGWSYVMNSRYLSDDTWGSGPKAGDPHREYGMAFTDSSGNNVSPGNMLLFAELPFTKFTDKFSGYSQTYQRNSSSGDAASDCTLQYDTREWSQQAETIGFNHKKGRYHTANVAWSDGHISQVMLAKVSGGDQTRLTRWFCIGYDLVYSPKTGWKLPAGVVDNK